MDPILSFAGLTVLAFAMPVPQPLLEAVAEAVRREAGR